MDRNEQILSLIGLCLRGRNLEVGEEPVEAVARARDARVILLAADAADNAARRGGHFAVGGRCLWLRVPVAGQVRRGPCQAGAEGQTGRRAEKRSRPA